jgi:hypothetical protein
MKNFSYIAMTDKKQNGYNCNLRREGKKEGSVYFQVLLQHLLTEPRENQDTQTSKI